MMTLETAAKHFNTTSFMNIDGNHLFYGQVLPFSDSVRSGPATRRRILEVDSSVEIPTTRIVKTDNQIYIVAYDNYDFFSGDVIRVKYPVLPVSSSCYIRTVGQVLTDAGGDSGVYVAVSYAGRTVFEEQSEYGTGLLAHFSSYNSIPSGYIVEDGSDYYKARADSMVDSAGFGSVEVVALTDPISSVTVQNKGTAINPITDVYVNATPITSVPIFIENINLSYKHETVGYVEPEVGDRTISFLKSDVLAISVNDEVGNFLVKAVDTGLGSPATWTVHGRPM